MQIKTFSVSVHDDGSQSEAMNRFMRGHQVLQVHREFVANGASSASWCFCVEYEEGAVPVRTGGLKKRVDYKEVLDEKDFAVFARLRTARKRISDEDQVPAFAICTDEQLAGFVRGGDLTHAGMKKAKGFGEKKVEKYAARLLMETPEGAA